MKKLLLCSVSALCLAYTSQAQTKVKYCDLIVYRNFLKNYVAELHIDGNKKSRLTLLKDETGKKMKFASEVDALNFVSKQGWELVSAYNKHGGESHFFMKKIEG